MNAVALEGLLVITREAVRGAEMPPDPFERQAVGTVALDLAGDLIAFVQQLNAERSPYVTTYSVEERLGHRHPGATLEPPKDRPEPQPQPDPEPEPDPQPQPTEPGQ